MSFERGVLLWIEFKCNGMLSVCCLLGSVLSMFVCILSKDKL